MYHLGTAEIYAEHYMREALREASHQHLVRLATRPGRPVRARLAEWLHALAVQIDQPVRLDSEPLVTL